MRKEKMRKDSAIETTMLTVKGFRLYVALQQGDESLPPLLLLNGIGANLEVFDPFIEALDNVEGQKIATIRFDVPGIGKSPLPPHPLRLRGLTDLVADLLDVLGHPVVDVLGVSWGGGWHNNSPTSTRRGAVA
jgi:pimeloyl-ACP methyl ester carboxylesterase